MASASGSGSAFKKSLIPWSKLDVELSEKTMHVLFNSGFSKMTPVQVSRILTIVTPYDTSSALLSPVFCDTSTAQEQGCCGGSGEWTLVVLYVILLVWSPVALLATHHCTGRPSLYRVGCRARDAGCILTLAFEHQYCVCVHEHKDYRY